MERGATARSLTAALGCLALLACDMVGVPVRPLPPAPVPVTPTGPTPKSIAAATYYNQVQQLLLSQGMLRTDGGSSVPVSPRTLTENFMRIALHDEYRRGSGGFVREETESRLRRWEVPVRVGVRFGASVALAPAGSRSSGPPDENSAPSITLSFRISVARTPGPATVRSA